MRPRLILLGALTIAAILVPVLTIRRVPTPSPDDQLYASIARSVYLYGVGVPSVTWYSPTAVDHVPFYGPVFYGLAAAAQRLFGPSLLSFRFVSLLGAIIFLAAGGLLARDLSGVRHGWLGPVAVLAITSEVNGAIANGTMHILAVGLETLALSLFIRGSRTDGGLWHGLVAGLLLTLAALTTPRTYPFIFGFLCAGAMLVPMSGQQRRAAGGQFAAAVLALSAGITVWVTASHGTPVRWARYFVFILSHEDTDVAILPTAVRIWAFHWSATITPVAAVVGAVVAAWRLPRNGRDSSDGRTSMAAFALVAAWTSMVVTFVGMNLTFSVAEYFALPLFAVVLALPRAQLKLGRGILVAGVAALVVCNVGTLAIRYARVAATWAARDPTPLNEFVRALVPPGSEVIGPEAPYFFPVERSGSRYRAVTPASWADWARWVPLIEPEATLVAARIAIERPRARFFIWPAGVEVPDGYACAQSHVVAVYHRPPNDLRALALLGFGTPPEELDKAGYPDSVLYRLSPDCPTGYDPTGRR